MTLREAVAAAFSYLEPRVRNYPKNEAAAMNAWVEDLARADVAPAELVRFVKDWCQRSDGFMPVPVDLLGPIYKARQQSDEGLVIHDPVKTGEHMGVVEIGSRARCEALGLPYVELREDERKALPIPEAREAAKERLERALAKVSEKTLRPARQRSVKFEGDDPEALAKRNAMVSTLSEGVGG